MALKVDEVNRGRGAMASLASSLARLALLPVASAPSSSFPTGQHDDPLRSVVTRDDEIEAPAMAGANPPLVQGSHSGGIDGGAASLFALALSQLHSGISRVEALEQRMQMKLDALDCLLGSFKEANRQAEARLQRLESVKPFPPDSFASSTKKY